MKGKKNPFNSDVLQALIDIRDEAKVAGDAIKEKQADDMIKSLEKDVSFTRKADERYKRHKYPFNHVIFVKLQNIMANTVLAQVSNDARSLFVIACICMSQMNLVELKRENILDCFGTTKHSFDNGLRELIENGLLTLYVNHSKEHGNIYMVNPDVAKIGRNNLMGAYEKATDELYLDAYQHSHTNLTVANHKMNINDDTFYYNSVCKE